MALLVPDGKRVAFLNWEPGKPFKIALVSAEGGMPQQVTAGERAEFDPAWSPDGNSLAFAEWLWGPGAFSRCAIHVVNLRTYHMSTLPGSIRLCVPAGRVTDDTSLAVRIANVDAI
jgi:WD40-like Beta Propeller Repeat